MLAEDVLKNCAGFEWDEANTFKNWDKHQISAFESEQIFFNKPLIILEDERHSETEKRFYALGKTNFENFLFIVFTVRRNKIRIISARKMSRKERKIYEKKSSEIQD